MSLFKLSVEFVKLDQRHANQTFRNLWFFEEFLICYHLQSLLALYQLRHTSNAFAEGLNIQNAKIINCHFEEGDFSRANFSNAEFVNTKFNKTILTDANFDGASFVNCNLNRVNITNANFCLKEIKETVVYGVSAWDLKTCDEMKQSRLIIEKTYELYSDIIASGKIPLMADNIELAQFIY